MTSSHEEAGHGGFGQALQKCYPPSMSRFSRHHLPRIHGPTPRDLPPFFGSRFTPHPYPPPSRTSFPFRDPFPRLLPIFRRRERGAHACPKNAFPARSLKSQRNCPVALTAQMASAIFIPSEGIAHRIHRSDAAPVVPSFPRDSCHAVAPSAYVRFSVERGRE